MATVLKDRIYIPVHNANMDVVEKYFLKDMFNDKACEKCEYFQERPCDTCADCPNYGGKLKMFNEKTVGSVDYVGIPLGARQLYKKIRIKPEKVVDKRKAPKIKWDIEFTGKLSDVQEKSVTEMIIAGYGILNAPPRAGKTVMAAAMVCEIRYKTIIMADQIDYLHGFMETFCGSDTQEPLTNVPDIESFNNVKIAGFCKTLADFQKHDICFATYQTFLSPKGQKLLNKIKGLFGILIVDEAHGIAAEKYSKVINKFECKHRFGLTGTIERKDGKEWITKYIIGPAMSKPHVVTMVPSVEFCETKIAPRYQYKNFNNACQFLSKDKKRNAMIIKHAVNDVKNGRSIVIPVMFKHHVQTLVDGINKAYGKRIAAGFTGVQGKGGKEKRKQLVLDARKYKIKVVVGIRKIVQTGINVPRWDTLYEVIPISNPPKFYQETSRIRTVSDEKKQPIIRFFIDDMSLTRGCLRTCMYKDGMLKMGFKFSAKDMAIAKKYTGRGDVNRDNHRPTFF